MIKSDKSSEKEIKNVIFHFTRSIMACKDIWGEKAFKRAEQDTWRDQFLSGVYDAEMIAVDLLSDVELKKAILKKDAVEEATRKLFKDPKFDQAVRLSTNTPSRLKYRVEKVLEAIRQNV